MKKARYALAAIANILIFALVAWTVGYDFVDGANGNMGGMSYQIFRYYTIDSNVLAGLFSVPMAIFAIRGFFTGKSVPAWVRVLRWVATTCIMITFLVVVLFLGMIFGFPAMFGGPNLYLHGVTPLLCLISFVFFEQERMPFKYFGWTLVPTIVYGVVYFYQVIVSKAWPDFYSFNIGGMWPVTVLVIAVVTCLTSWLWWLAHNAFNKKA